MLATWGQVGNYVSLLGADQEPGDKSWVIVERSNKGVVASVPVTEEEDKGPSNVDFLGLPGHQVQAFYSPGGKSETSEGKKRNSWDSLW